MRLFCLIYIPLVGLFIAIGFSSCNKDDSFPNFNLEQLPYPLLSDYGFFTGELKNQQPISHFIPFDLNTPLFSNFAGKDRFIFIPQGKQAVYNSHDVFDFPIGTILLKSFYFLHDIRDPSEGRTLIETRLLIHKSAGWESATYVWDDTQTEAIYYIAGKDVNVNWIHFDGTTHNTLYHIPNKNECKGCHNISEVLVPIGPKARNINKDFVYSTGVMNQLNKWTAERILSGAPSEFNAPRVPVWDDASTGSLNNRARAYLDINCAHCHNINGPANNSGLFLSYDETNSTALGICKPPVAAGTGSGGFAYSIIPGNPQKSIMIYRMSSNEPDVAMPELARSVMHEKGIQLISDWIVSLPQAGCK